MTRKGAQLLKLYCLKKGEKKTLNQTTDLGCVSVELRGSRGARCSENGSESAAGLLWCLKRLGDPCGGPSNN